MIKIQSIIPLLAVSLPSIATSAVLNVTPGVNNAPIAEVTFNNGGNLVTQTSSQPTTVNNQTSTAVAIENIKLTSGVTLDVFNFSSVNVNLQGLATPAGSSISNIGVLQSDGTQVNLNGPGGANAFSSALAASFQNSDVNNYLYYDNTVNPPAATIDFSVDFLFSLEAADYLLVQERHGNTFFEITPLDISGNPIAGANVLKFGGSGGLPQSVYDWNSGFSSSSYQSAQTYGFSVAEVSKFFEGTGIAEVPIFGFSIDNDGQADVKFYGASDNSFTNNPQNPDFVPEPSSAILVFLGLGLISRRRR